MFVTTLTVACLMSSTPAYVDLLYTQISTLFFLLLPSNVLLAVFVNPVRPFLDFWKSCVAGADAGWRVTHYNM
jgi:hypothetical protein